MGALVVGGGFLSVWLFPENKWANKWRYSFEDDLEDATFVLTKLPHDCEFLTAPLGDKHCHYEKQVRTIRVRLLRAGREVSYDEGKSWSKAEPSDHATVFVSWNRVED